MFTIKIADIHVCIDNKYDYVKKLCADYIVESVASPEMTVSVSDEEIRAEIELSESSPRP